MAYVSFKDGGGTTQYRAVTGAGSTGDPYVCQQEIVGTVAVTQSGTWNLTNISGTISLPTGAATAAKQPALGTAGSASTDVITVQGIASMTPFTVTGSGGTFPVTDSGGSLTVDAPVGTPVFVRLSDGSSAITTLPVSLASVPLATGAATEITLAALEAKVTACNTGAVVLAAGTASIGTLGANTGVTIGAVEIAASQTLNNLAQLGGQAIAMGTGTRSAGTQRVTIATDDVVPVTVNAGSNTIGNVGMIGRTSGGLTLSKTISAASTNGTSVKASAGQVFWIYATNTNAAARYLKLYNKASSPTVGTDTPVATLLIPGNTAGAGHHLQTPIGLTFSTGIAFALTTGPADSDTGAVAANEIIVNMGYV